MSGLELFFAVFGGFHRPRRSAKFFHGCSSPGGRQVSQVRMWACCRICAKSRRQEYARLSCFDEAWEDLAAIFIVSPMPRLPGIAPSA